MQKYLDPERQLLTPETMDKRRVETRKKVHAVMDFIRGSK